jgi:hypothetical protein
MILGGRISMINDRPPRPISLSISKPIHTSENAAQEIIAIIPFRWPGLPHSHPRRGVEVTSAALLR